MIRILTYLALLGFAVAILAPFAVGAQFRPLSDSLPGQSDFSTSITIVGEGARSLDDIANGFADPVEARRLLIEWGWQENAYRTVRTNEPALIPITSIETSLHRFSSAEGAAKALNYYADGRAEALGLAPLELTDNGFTIRAIAGAVADGYEITLYLLANETLVRMSAVGPTDFPLAHVVGPARRVAVASEGVSEYISPQFGYRIEWNNYFWPDAITESIPGAFDTLTLFDEDKTLHYHGQPAMLPDPATSEWSRALELELANYALDRADAYVGATVELQNGNATVHYRDEAGAERTEYITVRALLDREGLVFSTFTYPDGFQWAGPLPPGLPNYADWAAAADDNDPAPAPGDLQALIGGVLTTEHLSAAMPQETGNFVQVDGPRDQPFPWAVLGRSIQFDYVDQTNPTREASINIALLVESGSSTRAIRGLVNCCVGAVVSADVRESAPLPYFVAYGTEQVRLVWTQPGTNWIVTITAPTVEDAEALLQALIANL